MQTYYHHQLKTNLVSNIRFLCLLMALCLSSTCARSQEAGKEQAPVRQQASTASLEPIRYTLAVHAPEAGSQSLGHAAQLHVTITALRLNNDSLEFAIPAWTPGYYQILHCETGIHNVRAQDMQGVALAVSHPSPRLWARGYRVTGSRARSADYRFL